MRVQKSPTLSPVFLSVFIVAICMIGVSAANVQAATFTVMNTNDSGAGSLRQAIADANAAAGADTIDFDTGVFATSQSITLTTGELVINSEMTIQGPGANLLISGANASRIFFNDHGTMTLKGLTLTAGNGSGSQFDKFGGALYNNGGTVTIDGCRVAGNSGPDGGGGVYSRIGILTVRNSNVSGNFGGFDGDGGGIGGISGLTLVENSTFNGNSAFKGGGLKVSGSVTITNSTFSDNSAFYGGGISGESATLNIAASTLSGNRAGFAGGGVYGPSGASSIQNSIVAGNKKTPDSPNDIEGGMFGIADNNLIGDASTSGGAVNGVNGNIVGTNAMLGPLQFNGGATMTHALLPGSPAINAGGPTNLATDQRGIGFGRVVGAAADIGAFEVQPACAGISFLPTVNFAAPGPWSVTTGDFNGDGRTDLAVANSFPKNISVLIGNGDGTFAAAINFAVGDAPGSVTTGDFNGDGKTDLATANFYSNNVSVLTGNGDGTFAAAVNFPAGSAPWSVTTGDFNGDSRADVAVANSFSDNISVLMGNGDGTFAAAVNYPAGNSPGSVTTGDFNGDGKTDLAAAKTFSDDVSLLTGNGDGTFGATVSYPAGDGPESVMAGDFNADGKTDLVTANRSSDNISVLKGNGDGSFAPPVNYPAGDGAESVTAGDFNGDGKTDIAAANLTSNNISLFLGNGDGTFAPALNYPAGNGPRSVTTGDFNGDGRADLAAANELSHNISVLLNSCSANTAAVAVDDSFTTNEDNPLNVTASGVLGNDTDADGDTLTVLKVTDPANGTVVFNADGSFTYTPNGDFNGSDSFTYKANDGSLDSNTATVTITVNAINDAPVSSATPESQSVQYSDPISAVAITVTDIDSTRLTASTTFNVGGGAFSDGLPSGLSFGLAVCSGKVGSQCRWGLSGKANVAAGTYVIRVSVSDGVLSSYSDVTLVVNKEKSETVYTGDVFMFTAGPTVTTANVRLSAQLTQQADGNAGDITKAKVSFLLFKSTNLGATPDLTVSGVPVDATGAALTFVNLGVDTWTIKVKIDSDNGYWKASPVGMGTVTVEQPTTELRTSGGGWVADAQSMNGKGNFGFNVDNQKKGVRGGSVYLFRGLDGFNYLVKNTSWQSGGIGFSAEGTILSKAAFSGKCVVQKIDSDTGDVVDSFGNYSFTIDVRDGDLFNPRQADKYAITVLNSNGLVWRQIGSRTNPPAIGGGNITVKAK